LQNRRTTTQSSQHASDASAASLESLVARARQLPYELRCILARALAVDPEERYQSVDALGTDLRQYLEHQPVSAVPQTRAYVWRKFLHRHRLAAAFVSLVSLSLIGGLTMALWGLFEARDQRDLARAESERTTMALEFVSSMLESIDPDFAQGGDTLLISRLLEDAAFRADRALRNHPDIEADIQLTLGQTYLAIGDFQLAGQHLERSRELAADTGLHGVALRARKAQAVLLANQGDYSASEDILTDLLEQRSLLARDESTRLDALALLAHVYSQTQRPEQAREAARTVIDQTADDEAETLRLVRFEALMSLAQAYLAMSEYALSEQTYIQLEDEARAWAAPQARRHLASALNGRAITYLERQQHERAQPLLRESIQLTEERMGAGSPLTIFTRANLASSLRQTGQLQASRAEVERALDTAREHFGSESRIYIQISYNLGNLLREMGETREALELHRWTIEAARISFDHSDPVHSIFLTGLGQTELAAGHDPRAAEALELAATGLIEAFGPSHRRTLEAAEYLVKALDNLDRRDEARHWQDHLSRHGASVAN
jgi:eukaryotic-like serine/threonine-protein kinase